MNLHNQESFKKAYRSPHLFAYGDIRQLTQSAAVLDQNFDMHNPTGPAPNKTGFSM